MSDETERNVSSNDRGEAPSGVGNVQSRKKLWLAVAGGVLVMLVVAVTAVAWIAFDDSGKGKAGTSSKSSDDDDNYQYVKDLCSGLDWSVVNPLAPTLAEQDDNYTYDPDAYYPSAICRRGLQSKDSDSSAKRWGNISFEARVTSGVDDAVEVMNKGLLTHSRPTDDADVDVTDEFSKNKEFAAQLVKDWEFVQFQLPEGDAVKGEQWQQRAGIVLRDSNLVISVAVSFHAKPVPDSAKNFETSMFRAMSKLVNDIRATTANLRKFLDLEILVGVRHAICSAWWNWRQLQRECGCLLSSRGSNIGV